MALGTFTIYRGTHYKAIAWFLALIIGVAVVGVLIMRDNDVCPCSDGKPVPILGRFIVTPEKMDFVALPLSYPVFVKGSGYQQCA